MSAVSQAAESLAACGVPVFPCLETKRPATPHGFKDAVDSAAAARALWARYPGPLVGVPTGPASGIDALDIDPRHGGDRWWFQHRSLIDRTRVHRTRSDGLHVLFRHSAGVKNTAAKLAPGVDTRGEGGYVVWWPAAGCAVMDAPLAEWPSWLLERLQSARHAAPRLWPGAIYTAGDGGADRLADAVLRRLARAADGQKHWALRKAAYTIGGVLAHLSYGREEAVQRLVTAVEAAGALDLINAAKTARWGLERGEEKPLTLKGAGDE